jgi:DNA replication protein DnaC
MKALMLARQYVEEFEGNIASLFSLENQALAKTIWQQQSVMTSCCGKVSFNHNGCRHHVVHEDTFGNRNTSEEQLLNDLSKVDLLVIDEIECKLNHAMKKLSSTRLLIAGHHQNALRGCSLTAIWKR